MSYDENGLHAQNIDTILGSIVNIITIGRVYWEGLCDHLKSKRISSLDSCKLLHLYSDCETWNHHVRDFQLLTSQLGEPMWSLKGVRESPVWALVTFASLLQFWNLKWQISWFITIANWVKRFANWVGRAHNRATCIPHSSKGWGFVSEMT